MNINRLSTGVPRLDELLGGGLLPGTLTVVLGATGIGKTQLGVQFAHAGQAQEGQRGAIFDLAARGDAQSHAEYAQRICGWPLAAADPRRRPPVENFFAQPDGRADYLHVFDHHGRRVTRADLDFDQWRCWQAEINARLGTTIEFFYRNFIAGVRRVVIDGVEPAGPASQSIQLELFEYVYHQILRKDADWVARDLLREHFRAHAGEVARRPYDQRQIGCLLLCTSRESMLEDLIARPLEEGDSLANANTLIYMGKVRQGSRLGRALQIAKHRGSAASDSVVPFEIGERGIHIPS